MAQTIWKGHLAFGLVTIPVRLTAAARSESISFHMLHRNCGGRLEQKLACKRCGQPVSRNETLKGYEEKVASQRPRCSRSRELWRQTLMPRFPRPRQRGFSRASASREVVRAGAF